MQVLVHNDKTIVTDITPEAVSFIEKTFRFTDKSKQYQLKRMSKTAWGRSQPLYKQLQQEVEGKLYEVLSTGSYSFSSALYQTFAEEFPNHALNDQRQETGKKIALPWIKKAHDPRPYQEEALDLLANNYRGVINLATGLGKTLIATHAVKRYKKRSLIVCPSESVARQFYDLFVEYFGKTKVGFFGDGKKQLGDITVGIAASIVKNIPLFQAHEIGLIIVDEVHHVPANTFYAIAEGLSATGKIFGLTATDFRSDGKDIMITGGCGSVLIRRDIKWGVDNGWLAEPYFIVREVPTAGYDYVDDKMKAYKAHVLNDPLMKQQIEDDCRKMMAAGKSVLCLVDEVAHGQELAEKLGIPFATGIDSKSKSYVQALNDGTIPGLIGTDSKIGEGTDTRNVDVLIMANFVASKGPVIQCLGRGLRKQGTKTKCLVLDYIPKGSTILSRHAFGRMRFYNEITDKVKKV